MLVLFVCLVPVLLCAVAKMFIFFPTSGVKSWYFVARYPKEITSVALCGGDMARSSCVTFLSHAALSGERHVTEQPECHAVLVFDEIQLKYGLAYDPSNGTVVGRTNLLLAHESCPANALVTQALLLVLGGVTKRWKHTVAYKITWNSFSAAQKKVVHTILTVWKRLGLIKWATWELQLWCLPGIIVGKPPPKQ